MTHLHGFENQVRQKQSDTEQLFSYKGYLILHGLMPNSYFEHRACIVSVFSHTTVITLSNYADIDLHKNVVFSQDVACKRPRDTSVGLEAPSLTGPQ